MNKNLNQIEQVAQAVNGITSETPLCDLMLQLNQRAIVTALAAAAQVDTSGTKCATTLRLPPDINTFYRAWADVLGLSANQILEQILRGFYESEIAANSRQNLT